MHLYEWPQRVFSELPPPISKPFTSELWTERMSPGISTFFEDPSKAAASLEPLIAYAKEQLKHLEDQWYHFPIFLKATAGMRELPPASCLAIMKAVREYLAEPATCPFMFTNVEQARVIAGEEEAAFAWAGVNFVSGALLDSEWGTGEAIPKSAFGTLEMGGASTQIAFYQPDQNVLANLFKLQIGPSKHWNIYAHSFLQYGRVSARSRMWSFIAEEHGCFQGCYKAGCFQGDQVARTDCRVVDACLASGLSIQPFNDVQNQIELHPPARYHPVATNVWIDSQAPENGGSSWEGCLAQIVGPLGFGGEMKEERNKWCNYTHLGQCSFAGVYQPSLPDAGTAYGHFFLIGGYLKVWEFLGIGAHASLRDVAKAGKEVCALDAIELYTRFNVKHKSKKKKQEIEELCFFSAYAYAMLHHGHGFEVDRNFTALETMNYQGTLLKVGWQLGAILYEINTLPWKYKPGGKNDQEPGDAVGTPGSVTSRGVPLWAAMVGSLFASVVSFAVGMRMVQGRRELNSRRSGIESNQGPGAGESTPLSGQNHLADGTKEPKEPKEVPSLGVAQPSSVRVEIPFALEATWAASAKKGGYQIIK